MESVLLFVSIPNSTRFNRAPSRRNHEIFCLPMNIWMTKVSVDTSGSFHAIVFRLHIHSTWLIFHWDSPFISVPNLGNGHLLIDRRQWGASNIKDVSKRIPLHHPVQYVIITHIGVQSRPCDNVYACSIKMRTIQDSAIAEKGLFDVPANFYVSSILMLNDLTFI